MNGQSYNYGAYASTYSKMIMRYHLKLNAAKYCRNLEIINHVFKNKRDSKESQLHKYRVYLA